MTSSHQALLEWNNRSIGLSISSILIKNENVPLFEEVFGQLDYDWLLKITADRTHKKLEPLYNRYSTGHNLSLDPEYRKRDFYMMLLRMDDNLSTIRRMCDTRAKYYYYTLDGKRARFWFKTLTIKNILYYITSYSVVVMKLINKKFRVFG